MKYDAEANVLSWEIARGKINHVLEFGNIIIHLSKSNKPIMVEILDASKFVGQIDKIKKIKDINQLITASNIS